MATVLGTAGSDTIFPGSVTPGVTGGTPGAGADSILAGAGNDSLSGGEGNDTILGEDGFDTLFGFFGNDSLLGGNNDDVLNGGFGDDLIDGGSGFDIIEYGDILGPTAPTFVVNSSGGSNNVAVSGSVHGNDTVLAVEQINGSPGDDTIIINSVNTDTFLFYVRGGVGNDSIVGPSGFNRGLLLDYFSPLASSGVSVNLGTGRASDGLGGIDSFSNINAVRGTGLDDTLIGGATNDRFRGRGGNDSMVGGDGFDLADYTQAANAVSVNLALGRAQDGDGGTDTLVSIEQVRGSNFSDTLIGSTANEFFRGNAGNDSIVGGGGIDTLDYGSSSGTVNVNLSAGIFGQDGLGGSDSFSGISYLVGGSGNDRLTGSGGNETLDGGAGNDLLDGFLGNDFLIGGSGFDTATYTSSFNPITATVAFNGTSGHSATVSSADGVDTLREIEAINGSTGADSIQILSADPSTGFQARGYQGNDTIVGTSDRSFAVTADYLLFDTVTGAVTVDLQTGIVSNDGFGNQDLLINISFVRGTALGDVLLGSDGNDRFRGRGGNDFMDARGGTGDVADYAQSPAAVSVNLATQRAQDGEGGTDTVIGFEEVRATTGNDTLIGSSVAEAFQPFNGNDLVDGGGGQDRVIYGFTSGNVPSPTTGVTVNLVTGIASDGWGGTDTLTSIERVTGTGFADSMLGGAESNRFRGNAGDDTMDGGLGGDFAEYTSASSGATVDLTAGTATDGQGGTDRLISIENAIGSAFDDRLTGVAQLKRSSSDLRGGVGNDTLVGIVGEFVRADYADQLQALSINLGSGSANDGRGGIDTLINIRGLVMFGDHADTLVGTGNGEWFSPSLGADSIVAGGGLDIVSYGGSGGNGASINLGLGRARDAGGDIDTILGVEGAVGTGLADTILGSAVANLIAPNGGADSVNALGGEDTVSYSFGFSPDGTQYTANEEGDRLPVQGVTIDLLTGRATDFAGDIDTILGFEHAIGGTAADVIRGTGGNNALAGAEGNDTIDGRAGNDTLDGGAGIDRLLGGLGDDTLIIDGDLDVVVELADQGRDTVLTTRASYVLGANLENVAPYYQGRPFTTLAFTGNTLDNGLTGGPGADTLNGGAGNDTLFGEGGADRLIGGIGDDLYRLVAANDIVVEALNQGNDTIETPLSTYILPSNVEALIAAFGTASNFTGNALANLIVGGSGNDTLNGSIGNDTLDGGAGIDRLIGGLGNDVFVTNVSTDLVVELLNQGIDTVRTTAAAFVLGANVENLEATNAIAHALTGNALANAITGNAGADTLTGGAGNDTLDGGAGNDRMLGGGNDDTYIVTAGDLVIEALNQGTDTVIVTTGAGYVMPLNVEILVLGGAPLLNGTGNALGNTIIGNGNANLLQGLGGNDLLSGEGGNDILIGGLGRDTLAGGDGVDQFRFNAPGESPPGLPDLILDFTPGVDRIDLRAIDGNIAVPLAFVAGTPTGAGQVGVVSLGGGNWQVRIDVNGGGVDAAIDLSSATAPAANWFFL